MVRLTLFGIVLASGLLTACGPKKKAEVETPPQVEIAEQPSSSEALRPTTAFEIENTFDTWSVFGEAVVENSVTPAPDGVSQADVITQAASRSGIYQMYRDIPLTSGQTVEAAITAWADTPTKMTLYLMQGCGSTQRDIGAKVVNLTSEPQQFSTSHTFEHAHTCLRVQFALSEGGANVYLHELTVN